MKQKPSSQSKDVKLPGVLVRKQKLPGVLVRKQKSSSDGWS